MYQAVGIMELKSLAKGIEATDDALKSAGIRLVTAHPACPGKYEIILTGAIADVTAAVEHVRERFNQHIIDSSIIGRIDEKVITALFGTQAEKREGSLGILEAYSAASTIKAADIAVKTAKVAIYELRISRGMGGKHIGTALIPPICVICVNIVLIIILIVVGGIHFYRVESVIQSVLIV